MKVLLQHLLPQGALTSLAGAVADSTLPSFKNLLIRRFIRAFNVDLGDAELHEGSAYPSFNAFFTRALKEGARVIDAGPGAVVSPVDGIVSQVGTLRGGMMLQAKGRDYSARALLADASGADFHDGAFITLYLSPRHYHRVHTPLNASLQHLHYVPGRFFSVNEASVEGIDQLFARNERIICHFDTAGGAMALCMVGAMLVSGLETVWLGRIARRPLPARFDYSGRGIKFEKGEELGRFNMGSTVILLFAKDAVRWNPELRPGVEVKMGERLGSLTSPSPSGTAP